VVAQETISQRQDEIERLKALIPGELMSEVPPMSGQVLLVNPEWNFVIVSLGKADKLVPAVEMIIHRGDKMVGKVRITSVMDNVSVAEIQRGWEQLPIQEGDRVFN
ncbi:MAG: hypothetical protein U1E27_00240, partial [Kiritimatiellia bacterium]|nr:hypothetical protein [Kiritimatiellia bacterium]